MDPKRILMVISRFPPVVGGAERQCLNLSLSLASLGHKITVVTERLQGLKKREDIDGVQVLRLSAFPNDVRVLANLIFWANLKWFFIRKSNNFDIVHSHVATASAFFGSILAKLFGKPSIVKFTGSGITGEVTTSKASFFGKLKLKILDIFTDVVVCTDVKIKTELMSIGYQEEKIRVLPNGVDTGYFAPEQEKRSNNVPKVLFVGRLEDVKNVPALLKAWKTVISKANAELFIVGGGSKKDELIHLTEKLGINNRVKFLGEQKDIRSHLVSSDIFVLPSFAEGVSNSLLEALSCGLAVIASRVGGSVGLIKDGETGYLFDPKNHNELADKLERLLKDPVLRKNMGQKARENIVKNYSIESIRDKYIKLYDELVIK
ncbi:MAG: glycosyltransferase family 4 protein [Elusimicrobia bacterium]|nr:glycosyltransferase family 4 protein [Candidatus Liberimonas magnetica]